MATQIHPTAIIEAGAQLDEGVEVGPYSVVGAHVQIGAGTRIMAHAVLAGHTTLGAGCTIFPFASVGQQTQDLKFKGGAPGLIVGERTTVREFVTLNAATYDGAFTRVGAGCHLMAYSHVAHDCVVGDEVIMANAATLAGHVTVEDQAILGGLAAVHQFVRIGRLSIIGGCSKVVQDIAPFMMADGNPLALRTINKIGLERHGIGEPSQQALKACYKLLCRSGLSTSQALEKIVAEVEQGPEVAHLVAFIRSAERGITKS